MYQLNNEDDKCLKRVVTTAIYQSENHPERITKVLKTNAEKFNWEGVEGPMQVNKILIFKKNNSKYGINFYGYKMIKSILLK